MHLSTAARQLWSNCSERLGVLLFTIPKFNRGFRNRLLGICHAGDNTGIHGVVIPAAKTAEQV